MGALLDAQCQFAEDLIPFLQECKRLGYRVKLGEVLRPPEMQTIYLKQGKSWAPNSRHLCGLALDFQLFRGDRYLTDEEEYAGPGLFWESLRPENVWGASSGRPRKDAGHVERRKPS